MIKLLVEMLSRTQNVEYRYLIMQCIGELGAIDPCIVAQFNSSLSKLRPIDRWKRSKASDFPKNIHAMVALLLDKYLVPTLMAQRKNPCASTSRINSIGLAVQELIRVCGCKKNTALRASKTSNRNIRKEDEVVEWDEVLMGETNEENAIYFWENLLRSTRQVIEPYLAEPFDVQHYQSVFGGDSAGNEEVACQPVWSKIKAASSVGAIANAQNGGAKQLYSSWTSSINKHHLVKFCMPFVLF